MDNYFKIFVYFFTFVVATSVSGLCVKIGSKYNLIDSAKLPRIGGLAVLIAWWFAALFLGFINPTTLLPLVTISAIILLFGLWDAHKPMSSLSQLLIQILIAVLAVYWGEIGIKYITNPLGGIIDFRAIHFFGLFIPSEIISILWIIFMMNVINFLDGMDGLAGCVTCVAFIAIGLVSLLPQVNDINTAIAAFTAAVAIMGFMFWNFPPASLILGTVGSWFLGFLIAILAIQGATKVATTAVVGAVPLIDAIIVVIGRLKRGQSPFKGDLTHLHHRLKRRGMSDRLILGIYTTCSILLGLAAVLLQTRNKVIIFIIFSIFLVFFILIGSYTIKYLKSSPK